MSKLKMWNKHSSWEAAEAARDRAALQAAQQSTISGLNRTPDMPGITPDTAKNLKWKSLKWMITKDDGAILKGFLKHPLRYGWALLRSVMKKKSFVRDDDFFLYGIKSVAEFRELLKQETSL